MSKVDFANREYELQCGRIKLRDGKGGAGEARVPRGAFKVKYTDLELDGEKEALVTIGCVVANVEETNVFVYTASGSGVTLMGAPVVAEVGSIEVTARPDLGGFRTETYSYDETGISTPNGEKHWRLRRGEWTDQCAELFAVGARGSGQTAGDAGGYGDTVVKTMSRLRGRLREFDIHAEPLAYPALGAGDLLLRPKLYYKGVALGVDVLTSRLEAQAERCPGQPIVLAGFSQGAMVVNRTLVVLAESQSPVLASVVAVELLADPQRIGTTSYQRGDASTAFNGSSVVAYETSVPGIFRKHQIGFPADPLPDNVADKADSYCVDRDPVCAWNSSRSLAKYFASGDAYVDAFKRHANSYRDNGDALAAGVEAAKRARVALDALPIAVSPESVGCTIPCQITGQIDFEHPSWGRVALVTMKRGDSTCDPVRFVVVNRKLEIKYQRDIGDCYETLEPAVPSRDGTGHLFLAFNPGRYDGFIVLAPTAEGFNDLSALSNDSFGRFYYAELADTDGDGILEILVSDNDCEPDCASGSVTVTTYKWNGTDYQALPAAAPPVSSLVPGAPCKLGSNRDCIDPDGDGQGTYLIGGGDCVAALGPRHGGCEDLDGDGYAGYPDSG